jgi:hypothetical protein
MFKLNEFKQRYMHPLNPDVQRQLYIDQTRISHIITKAWFDGNYLKGIVECAPTAVGRDMQGLVRAGSRVAFSMRGFGFSIVFI